MFILIIMYGLVEQSVTVQIVVTLSVTKKPFLNILRDTNDRSLRVNQRIKWIGHRICCGDQISFNRSLSPMLSDVFTEPASRRVNNFAIWKVEKLSTMGNKLTLCIMLWSETKAYKSFMYIALQSMLLFFYRTIDISEIWVLWWTIRILTFCLRMSS